MAAGSAPAQWTRTVSPGGRQAPGQLGPGELLLESQSWISPCWVPSRPSL